MKTSELRTILRLSGPLAFGYVGSNLMSLVDGVMVGRLGATALAGVGIGNGLYFTVYCLGQGCVLGMDAPTAQAVGAGEWGSARRLFWQGVRVALLVSLPLVALLLLVPSLLPWVGVEAGTSQAVRSFLLARSFNLVPSLLFAAQRSYLQAVGAARVVVFATVLGNVVNFIGNVLLIYGDAALVPLGLPRLGLPALGIVGSGLSSTLASAAMALLLGRAVAACEAPADPARRRYWPEKVRTILRLGAPSGLQMVAEVGVFAAVGVLAGRLGAAAGAAHFIALTLSSLTFCVTLGIGAATSVRVGVHIGAGDTPGARRAGFTGMWVSTTFMSFASLLFLVEGRLLARLFTSDPSLLALAQALLYVAALFQVSDGLQATGAAALRGAGDAHLPLYINLVAHWLLGLPIAIALGFPAGLGVTGLWWGLSLSLTLVALLLILRFSRLSARPIRRV